MFALACEIAYRNLSGVQKKGISPLSRTACLSIPPRGSRNLLRLCDSAVSHSRLVASPPALRPFVPWPRVARPRSFAARPQSFAARPQCFAARRNSSPLVAARPWSFALRRLSAIPERQHQTARPVRLCYIRLACQPMNFIQKMRIPSLTAHSPSQSLTVLARPPCRVCLPRFFMFSYFHFHFHIHIVMLYS